jgi:hypothetical protein
MLAALVAASVLQSTLTPLTVNELTGLLDGVVLQSGDIVLVSGAEHFFSGGRYVVPARIYVQGSWRVSHGMLCRRIRDAAVERCTPVASEGRGRFFAADSEADMAAGRTYEIRFVPVLTRR